MTSDVVIHCQSNQILSQVKFVQQCYWYSFSLCSNTSPLS